MDTETRDPNLKDKGPGFIQGHGEIHGVSVATDDQQWYFPVNVFGDGLFEWLRDLLSDTTRTVLFANAQYDLGWLRYHGVVSQCKLIDIQITESLLEEEHPDGYTLDAIARRRLGYGKDESLLRQAAQEYGIDPKSELWKLPNEYVGPYAEADARITYDIWQVQKPLIAEENLEQVFELEQSLIPILLNMTFKGIRIDVSKAEQLSEIWKKEEDHLLDQLGMTLEDINSTATLAKAFLRYGVQVPRTELGNPSVTRGFLEHLDLDFAAQIKRVKELNKLRRDFIDANLLQVLRGNRIHPHYTQVRRAEADEDGEEGTRTGRFSSRNPNEQQIPKRSSILVDPGTFRLVSPKNPRGIRIGKVIRSLRLPEPGHLWAKNDYSSQEPRWQIHYGLVQGFPGAAEAAEAVSNDIKLYSFMEQSCPQINYDQAKAMTLGRSYGMGKKKMAESLGMTESEAETVLALFDSKFGYIKMLADSCTSVAQKRGYIRTMLGRRRRFNWWQSDRHWDYIRERKQLIEERKTARNSHLHYDRILELNNLTTPVYGLDAAQKKWPRDGLRRAFTNKAFNALIQGNSADQAKLAVRAIDQIAILLSLVHDEINTSVPDEATALRVKETMENVVKLRLPVVADIDLGDYWQ